MAYREQLLAGALGVIPQTCPLQTGYYPAHPSIQTQSALHSVPRHTGLKRKSDRMVCLTAPHSPGGHSAFPPHMVIPQVLLVRPCRLALMILARVSPLGFLRGVCAVGSTGERHRLIHFRLSAVYWQPWLLTLRARRYTRFSASLSA
ncbi:hypothetical protein OH77DRAFT_933907 [Trametes cingulata]|nr:hypothetical protein OH77DRAFT_933907 [Trametes cingulata]